MGLLPGQRCNQAPVDTGRRFCGMKMLAQLGQGGFDAGKEFLHIDLLETANVSKVSFLEARQCAIALNPLNEGVDPRL